MRSVLHGDDGQGQAIWATSKREWLNPVDDIRAEIDRIGNAVGLVAAVFPVKGMGFRFIRMNFWAAPVIHTYELKFDIARPGKREKTAWRTNSGVQGWHCLGHELSCFGIASRRPGSRRRDLQTEEPP